jgi:hypothetical protein
VRQSGGLAQQALEHVAKSEIVQQAHYGLHAHGFEHADAIKEYAVTRLTRWSAANTLICAGYAGLRGIQAQRLLRRATRAETTPRAEAFPNSGIV